MSQGIRVELRDRFENGDCIQTTSVHPGWHSTGIVKPLEAKLVQHGIEIDPPKNVSDAVLKQVLEGRSGLLFVPKRFESRHSVRFWPIWIQDVRTFTNRIWSGFQH